MMNWYVPANGAVNTPVPTSMAPELDSLTSVYVMFVQLALPVPVSMLDVLEASKRNN